jgi:hypothetical protein
VRHCSFTLQPASWSARREAATGQSRWPLADANVLADADTTPEEEHHLLSRAWVSTSSVTTGPSTRAREPHGTSFRPGSARVMIVPGVGAWEAADGEEPDH